MVKPCAASRMNILLSISAHSLGPMGKVMVGSPCSQTQQNIGSTLCWEPVCLDSGERLLSTSRCYVLERQCMLADPGSWQRPVPRETGQGAVILRASVGTERLWAGTNMNRKGCQRLCWKTLMKELLQTRGRIKRTVVGFPALANNTNEMPSKICISYK